VSLRSTAPKGEYSIRYHVPRRPRFIPTEDVEGDIDLRRELENDLEVRYLIDKADYARVVVMLKKYSLEAPPAGEVAQIVAVFDSNDHPESPQFQSQKVRFNDELDDPGFAYFIEALLIRNPKLPLPDAPGGPLRGPALAAIRICPSSRD
jgi:hypothetical protein